MDGDTGGALRDSDGNPNLLNADRNGDGRWLNANYDKPDDRWNRDGGFAFTAAPISSFLSRHNSGRVLFCQLSVPAAEHPADFVERHRECETFLVVQRFSFPEQHQQDFEGVELPDRDTDVRDFFSPLQEGRGNDRFNSFHEQIVSTRTERSAVYFGDVLKKFVPNEVSAFALLEDW